ncbi:Ankyrin repeat protein [uncultured virus]|nr:Ankyrin repeat protein [uncultured virus]
MKTQRYPNKVRINETGNAFRDKTLKILQLRSVPDVSDDCSWELIYKTLSVQGKTLGDHLGTAVAEQDECVVELIIATKEVPSEEVIIAAAQGSNRILSLCLSAPQAKVPYQALLYAVNANNIDNVRLLIQDRRAPIVPANINQPTLLATAVKNKNYAIVELLLKDNRADPDASNGKALYLAAYGDDLAMVKLLLDYGADPNIGDSPFVAATVGNLDIVQFLLSDPRVDLKRIPITYLRTVDENRNSQRPSSNKDLPVQSRETYNKIAVLLNAHLYTNSISGLFLGYYLATGTVDAAAIGKLLTGPSLSSRYLRYITLERPSAGDVIQWLIDHEAEFPLQERQALLDAVETHKQVDLYGNVALAAFFRLGLGWTFLEIYEDVSRNTEYDEQDILMASCLLGAYKGLEGSLDSGITVPPQDVLDNASKYSRDTHFGILRPRT